MLAALGLAGADLPSLPPIRRDPQVTYLDRAGAVIGVRGGRYGPPVDVARLPAYVPAAFVAIEDRRFYEHGAVDPLGMARALMADLASGRTAQGGSTITQRLARNLFLGSEQTLERKGQEMVLAEELERRYSRNRSSACSPQPHLSRLRRLRPGGGGRALLQQAGPAPDGARGSHAGGHPQVADRV